MDQSCGETVARKALATLRLPYFVNLAIAQDSVEEASEAKQGVSFGRSETAVRSYAWGIYFPVSDTGLRRVVPTHMCVTVRTPVYL